MLILPPGHGEMLRTRPKLAGRERRMVASVGALVAVIAAVTVVSLAFLSSASAPGCVDATVPGVIGATTFHECGAGARQLCATPAARSGLSPYGLGILRAACRKAGFTVPAATARH